MKTATITIYKAYVLYDIDSLTFKRVDGEMSDQTDRVRNALSSDSEEELDKVMLHRYMEGRDATLRTKLAFCLVSDEADSLEVDNNPSMDSPSFVYKLNVPDHFNAEIVKALSQKIHNYLVDGTAYDWYSRQGTAYAVGQTELDDMLKKIASSLRKSFVYRPLQPFGPAK